MFNDNTVTASLSRIKNALSYSLEHNYNDSDSPEIVSDFLKLHGLHPDNFDFIKNVEALISEGIVDNSIDQNSNKNETTVVGIMKEATDSVSKVVGYRYLYRKIKELYGKKEAKRLMGKLYDFSLAISDSTKMNIPYCYAFDFTKIVLDGRPYGQLPSAPPKRLSSYIAALNETVHQLSNHLAGAEAMGSFFFDVAHVLIYREHVTNFNSDNIKYITNCFQTFVHSVNHLSRNAVESPFTNISIFDRGKLDTFLSDTEMGWYFPTPDEYSLPREQWQEFVREFIIQLQDIFMEFFDKGDPLNGGIPYRFPVVTLNISKDENGSLLDLPFLNEICNHEIYRYNIMVSEGTRVASCCRLLSDADMLSIGGQVNSFGGAGISLGSHRVVTINFNRIALEATSYENYITILEERIEQTAKILKAHKEMLIEEEKQGLLPFVSNGYIRFARLFSTFGVMGLYEAAETMKNKFGDNGDIIEASLRLLDIRSGELSKKYGLTINIEQIPGESMAVKLRKADTLIYGNETVPYEMYSNQFIPLWEDATIWDRMDIDGKYNKMFTGGGIVHFNLGERITSGQARELIQYAAKSGCEHFALNSVYSKCKNGHVVFGNVDSCPICKDSIQEKYSRVVGFMTPVSSWNSTRRTWEFPRRKFRGV